MLQADGSQHDKIAIKNVNEACSITFLNTSCDLNINHFVAILFLGAMSFGGGDPEWRSGLRHCISVLEASLETSLETLV